MGLHAEPYEFPEEFLACAPSAGIALFEASGKQLGHALNLMDDAHVWLPVIGYSETPTLGAIVQAVHFGAAGYLAWPFDTIDVSEALTMIARIRLADSIAMPHEQHQPPVDQFAAISLVAKLTNRERQVLDQLLAGHPSREIGDILQISFRTVEVHRLSLMRKLHARNVVDAVRIAIEAKRRTASVSRAKALRGFGDCLRALGSTAA